MAERVWTQGNGSWNTCDISNDDSACPVTQRLKDRVQSARLTLCFCQNPSLTFAVTPEISLDGPVAHLTLYNGSVHMDLLMVDVDGQLEVDDVQCTGGGPATSVYVNPYLRCV